MRTRQPATELGVVFRLAGKKHGLGTNLFSFFFLRQDPLEAILVIFGRRALIFFCLKALGKNEK